MKVVEARVKELEAENEQLRVAQMVKVPRKLFMELDVPGERQFRMRVDLVAVAWDNKLIGEDVVVSSDSIPGILFRLENPDVDDEVPRG